MSRYMNYDSTSTPKAATLDNLELSTKLMLEAADEIDRLEQRIRELVQQCEKLREERNTVRVKVEQPLLLRIRELEQLANEAIEVIEDMAGGPCYPSIEFRKRLEPPR